MKKDKNLLWPTCDRKTRAYTQQYNTFGLLPGNGKEGTCPCATTKPGGCWHVATGRKLPTCYVAKLQRAYVGVNAILQHNTQLLKKASYHEQVKLLKCEFERFRTAELKKSPENPILLYRIHWSGDIFSVRYAKALSAAMQAFPDIKFWCYTRSFFAVPHLSCVPNLNLILSFDPVNIQEGLKYLNHYRTSKKPTTTTIQFCYMVKQNDFDFSAQLANFKAKTNNENATKWLSTLQLFSCPVDTKKLELESGCYKCKWCSGRCSKPIWFES